MHRPLDIPSKCINDHEDELVERGRRYMIAIACCLKGGQSGNERLVWEEARRKYENGNRQKKVGQAKDAGP